MSEIKQTYVIDPEKENPMVHGQRICDSLAKDLQLYPIIAIVLEGHNTVKLVRKMVGAQSPEDSEPGTIRGDYSQDTGKNQQGKTDLHHPGHPLSCAEPPPGRSYICVGAWKVVG